tara:strand:+ start:6 stop:692 length:687 start_codon:yes stop_codon:yes gene_type:complete
MFNNISCITFDLDDTLWPVKPVILKAEQALYQWLCEHYPRVTDTYTVQQLTQQRVTLTMRYPDISHDVSLLRWQFLAELAEQFDYPDSLADQGLNLFRQYRNQVTPFAEAEAVLTELGKAYTIGAITNGNAELDKISLGQYFDFITTAADVGANKPCVSLFQQAASEAAVETAQIVHIGDSAEADVIGANKAGCYSIWFNPARHAWPGGQSPDAVIHSLAEVPALING